MPIRRIHGVQVVARLVVPHRVVLRRWTRTSLADLLGLLCSITGRNDFWRLGALEVEN